jgi:hypothetical protein
MGAPYPSGSAYATRRSPPMLPSGFSTPLTTKEPSSPSFAPPSPLTLRPDEGVSRHHRIRAERGGSRRHRERLKGDYGAEFGNWDNSAAVEGEDGKGMDGKSVDSRRGGGGLRVEPSPSRTKCERCNEPQQWKYNGRDAVQLERVPSGTIYGALPRRRIHEREETCGPKFASE